MDTRDCSDGVPDAVLRAIAISDRIREALEVSNPMREAIAISDRIRGAFDMAQPMRDALAISDRLRKTFEASGLLSRSIGTAADRIISEQCEIIGATATEAARKSLQALAVPNALQASVDELTERTERAAKLLPDFSERPQPVLHDLPPLMPTPERQTPAAETIEPIREMWEQRRREIEGTPREAFVRIAPPDGRAMVVHSLATEGDNFVMIRGQIATGEEVSITVGATAFQVEVITLDKTPKKPDLRIVE